MAEVRFYQEVVAKLTYSFCQTWGDRSEFPFCPEIFIFFKNGQGIKKRLHLFYNDFPYQAEPIHFVFMNYKVFFFQFFYLRKESCSGHLKLFKDFFNTFWAFFQAVSYTHLRAHETDSYLVCRLLL